MNGEETVAEARLARAALALAPGLFSGKRVIVSGGGTGIGKSVAWVFGRLGASLVLCGRRQERLDAASEALRSAGIDAEGIATDIRDEEAVQSLFECAGDNDVLINNAGGQYAQSAASIVAKGWRAVVETNLTGSWFMMQAATREWIRRGCGGSIVNITASNARGMPGIIHSSAARAGVENASRTAAIEWARYGIRVNCVAPGLINTPGLDVYPAEARAGFVNANPQRRAGDPWELAQTVAFVASDAASFITGATLVVDGGGALSGELWTHEPSPYGVLA